MHFMIVEFLSYFSMLKLFFAYEHVKQKLQKKKRPQVYMAIKHNVNIQ